MLFHRKGDARAGYVLVEVLVATAVAALIFTALIRSFATTWSNSGRVREEAEAVFVGRAVLQAVGARTMLRMGSQDGTSGPYAWSVSITEPPAPIMPDAGKKPAGDNSDDDDDDGDTNRWTLYRITIAVTAPSGRKTTLDTFRLGPKQS